MAKTKEEEEGGGRPQPKSRNNNNNKNIKDKNNDRNKKNLENGLYVHSSPPKALNSNSGHGSASIRDYIRAADIGSLEEVVLQGQGTKLVNQPATDPRVRNFLKTVPSYMSKIDLLHDAVEKGNLRELKALLDRRKLARSKDSHGVGLLHKAVVHDHRDIVDYLISDYPETLDVTDNEGRTPLHYCAASSYPDDMYSTLCDAVSDTQVQDNKGKTAADYMSNPRELNVSRRRSNKGGSGGSKSKNRTPKKRGSPGQIRTPPKREGMNITGANIRIWIHDKDLSRLEQIVWEGQGHRLLKETSNNAKVRQFLNLVPRMMMKIKEVHQAALNGDLETLDAKVDQPDILIAKDQNGLNPLHKSAALGHKDVSEWIVQKNQSTVFAQDRKGRTPLFYAGVAKDGGEVYDMLLRSGADPNHTDQYRKTAEHYRFKPNELDLSLIHETPVAPRGGGGSTLDIPGPSNQNSRAPSRSNRSRNPSRRNSTGSDKKGPSKKKDHEGDDMDFKDMKDVTDAEIENYIREGDLDSLENIILSGRGADLQGRSSWNEDVRRFLKKVPGYMEKITSLQDAAASGNMTNVRRLAKENGKLVMARGKDGGVGLHYAARSGDPKITKYLLGLYSPAVNIEDNDGKNPLHYSALSQGKGAHETYELLKKEGASSSTTDLAAIEELHEAVEEGETRKVMNLLDKKQKAYVRDSHQANILHKAVLYGHTDLVRYLVSSFPDLMKQEDMAGRTPQHYAAVIRDGGHIYKILDKEGADDDVKDDSGHTPNDYKNNPNLLTQWDLMRELKDGTADSQADGKGRPFTKGSIDSQKEDGKKDSKENGKITPNPKENGKVTPDPKTNGRLTPDPKANGKTTPDPKTNGKVTPDPKTDGRITPDPKHNGKTTPDPKANGKITPVPVAGGLSRRGSNASVDSEFPGMWSEDGQYLTNALGDALINGLSEVNQTRPKDPIAYLACSLYKYRYNKPTEEADTKNESSKKQGTTGSGGSNHSTIAMQTAVNSTGGNSPPTTPQTRDKNGQSVLHFAAARPHGRSAFYRLIEDSDCNLSDRDDHYRTPRDVATEKNLQENVRAIDKYVINLAAQGNIPELKKLLIDGYDHIVDIDDENDQNILEVAQKNRQYKTVDFLRSIANFEEKVDWLHKAIRIGSLPHVQYIADTEELARAKDERSRTSLHIATLCEEKEIMEYLSTKYPDLVMIGDNLERTPLHYAMAVEGVDQVAKILVQAGARRAVKDLRGKQPSYYFMNRGEVVEMIKEVTAEA